MGGILKYSTEMYSYVASFGLAMNEATWKKLPPDLQQLITQSVTGVEKEIGETWDELDGPAKQVLLDSGDQVISLSRDEQARFRTIGAEVTETKRKELDRKRMPAHAVYAMMKSLAERHAQTSKTFWE
jgi:TRAP-type C4-dicarboxylate transport system substrate-binding protein